MTKFGYARVSTTDQDLTTQIEALEAARCDLILREERSETSEDRGTMLDYLLRFLRKDDTLLVTRIDRVARSFADLQHVVQELNTKGAHFKATEQPIDTSTAGGKAFLDMLVVFAEFESNLRRERQLEGIAKAKAEGRYKGRKPSIDPARVSALVSQGLGAAEIAQRLKIGRASVYRMIRSP